MFILGLTFAWTAPMLQIQIDTLSAQERIDKLGASIVSLGDKIGSAEASTKSAIGRMFKDTSFKAILEPLNEIKNTLNKMSASKVSIKADTSEVTKSVSKLKQSLLNQVFLFNIKSNSEKEERRLALLVVKAQQYDKALEESAKKENERWRKMQANAIQYDKSLQASYSRQWGSAIEMDKKENERWRRMIGNAKEYDKLLTKKASAKGETFASKDAAALASMKSYISQMERLASAGSREEQQLLQLKKGWNLLTDAQQKAALMTQDTARAMRIVEPLLNKQIDALARYQKQANAINNVRTANITSGGTQGINQSRADSAFRSANAELRKNGIEALKAEQAVRRYANSAHLGTQATAGFRAALHGANINMGYFTASTVAFAAAGYVLSKATTAAITSGAQFEFQFERVAVLLEEMGKIGTDSFGKLSESAGVLKDKIFELAESTQFNPTQVAQGAEVLAQAGYETLDVYNALSPVLNLASVGMVSVADAADLATGVMSGFSIGSSQLTSVVDSLAIATVKSKLSMADIATTMKYVSGTAGNLGLTLNDTLVTLEAMAESNTRSSRAGTATRSILPDILGQSKGVTALLKKLGIDIKTFSKDGILDIKAFFASLKDANASDIQEAFGKIPANAVLALVKSATLPDSAVGSWKTFTEGLKNADGAAKQLTQGMRQNLLSALETLRGNLETISSTAFDTFGQGIEDSVRDLTSLLNENSDAIAQTIAKYVQMGVAVANFVIANAGFIAAMIKTVAFYQILKGSISLFRVAVEGLEVLAKGRELSTVIRNQRIISSNKLLEASALSAARAQASIGLAGAISPVSRAATASASAFGVGAGLSKARNIAAVETGLVSATKASAGFLGGLGRISSFLPVLLGGLGRVVGFLTGPWGIALTGIASVGFAVYESLDTGEKQVRRYSNAMDIFALATQRGTKSLQSLSQENLKVLSSKLEGDVKTAAIKLEEANKAKNSAGFDLFNAYRTKDVWFIGEDRLTKNLAAYNAAVLKVSQTEAEASLIKARLKDSTDNLYISMGKNFAEAQQLGTAINSELSPAIAELQELTKTPLEAFLVFKDPSAQVEVAKNFVETLPPLKAKAVIDWANIGALPQETALTAFANITRIKELLIEIKAIEPFSNLLNLDLGKFGSFARSFIKGIGIAQTEALTSPRGPELSGRTPADIEAETAYKTALQQSMSTMETYIKDFEKRTGSTAELTRQLKELSVIERQIGSGEAAAKLKEMGVSVDQAMKAVDFGRRGKVLEYLSQKLAEVDPRFADLSKALTKTTASAYTAGQTLPIVTKELEKLAAEKGISPALMQGLLTDLPAALSAIETGAFQANKEFDALIEKSKIDWAALTGADSLASQTRDNAVGKYEGKDKEVAQRLAIIKLTNQYGDAVRGTLTVLEKEAELETLLAAARGKNGVSKKQEAAIRRSFYENTPAGALEKENRNLQNQLALVGQGSEALELYNAKWAATNGTMEDLGPAYDELIKSNIRWREELEQTTAVQETFERFGEGVAGTFRDIFNGGIKTFGDFASKLKQEFKNLIAELVYMAIKNSIMSSLFGQGSGNTQGFFGAITQGFSQITGGRSNGGFGGGGLGGLFSSFFGGGTGQSTASAGKGLDLGSLTSNAVSSYTGASSSSGGGLGQFFSSLAGGNGLSFDQMASYFSPGFGGAAGGAAGGVPSGLFGGGGKFLKGGSAGKGPITTVGSGTPAAIAQGGLLGGITGLYQGYKAGGGGLSTAGSTLTYGLGGATLGAAGASILATGGLAGAGSAIATAGSAAGLSAGAAAALPIIGWIAAATMLIDQFTGGKVFGTKYRPESVTENIALGVAGGDATLTRRDVRQRSLFKGRQWTNVAMDVPSEMQKMANDFFKIIDKTMSMTGRELEVKVPKMIEASFSTKTEYDKKGKETGKKTSAVIAGISYEDISFEDFQKISNAEQMIAVVRQSVSEIMQQGVVDSLSTTSDEVSSIVNAWRGDVDLMLEGAALLVAAQNDIVDGSGLFGEVSGSLTLAVAAAEKYQNSNETLADTYLRVKETVKTVEDSFGFFGISLGRTREQFVDFSMELVNSLGGLDKAGEKLRMFAEAYGQIGGGDLVAGQAFKRRGTLLGAVGLDADTSGSDFGGAFTRALPSLSPEDLASWVEAGNSIAVVNSALKEMAASASLNSANDLVTQVDNQIAAIARLGASEAELAQAREYGNTIIKNALDELMAGIDEGLAGFEGRTNVASLNKIRKEMEANIVQARRLGASLSQLARIQQLAAYQIQKVLADLRFSITDLTKQLYNTDAIENATNQQLDASNSLQEAELERYKASQDAIKKIIDFLKDLDVSDLAPGGTKDRLAAAGTQFRDLLLKAQSGDPEALNGITDAAKTYLELAKEYFGSTPDYGLIFTEVTSALTSLTGLLGQIEPPTGSSGGSSSDSSSQASTQKTVEEIKAERFQLALTLSQSLGELGIGLQTDVYGLIKEFGIDIVKLASDLGIDKTSLNKGSVSNIGLMAQALGVPVKGLIDKLGITGNQIADAFGIKFGDYSTANLTALKDLGTMLGLSVFDTMSLVGIDILSTGESLGLTLESLDENSASRLVELATTLGVQSSDLMTALGISISDLAIASGINIKDLTGEMFTKLIDFANILGTDILSLGTTLGADPKQIAEGLNGALTTGVEAIPGMPQSIKDELQPFLDAIKNADSSAAVKKAVEDLIGFTNLLPEEQKNKLLGLFEGLGLNVDTGTKDIGRILTEQYLVLRPVQQATSEAARDTVTSVDETNRLLRDELAPIFRDIRDSVTAPVQQKSLGAPVDEFMDKSKTQQEENYKQQVKNNEAQAAQNKEMAEQVKALTEALYRQSTVAAEQTEESIKNLQKISKNTKKASETPRTVSKKL